LYEESRRLVEASAGPDVYDLNKYSAIGMFIIN
jgi:hypothetical protein